MCPPADLGAETGRPHPSPSSPPTPPFSSFSISFPYPFTPPYLFLFSHFPYPLVPSVLFPFPLVQLRAEECCVSFPAESGAQTRTATHFFTMLTPENVSGDNRFSNSMCIFAYRLPNSHQSMQKLYTGWEAKSHRQTGWGPGGGMAGLAHWIRQ